MFSTNLIPNTFGVPPYSPMGGFIALTPLESTLKDIQLILDIVSITNDIVKNNAKLFKLQKNMSPNTNLAPWVISNPIGDRFKYLSGFVPMDFPRHFQSCELHPYINLAIEQIQKCLWYNGQFLPGCNWLDPALLAQQLNQCIENIRRKGRASELKWKVAHNKRKMKKMFKDLHDCAYHVIDQAEQTYVMEVIFYQSASPGLSKQSSRSLHGQTCEALYQFAGAITPHITNAHILSLLAHKELGFAVHSLLFINNPRNVNELQQYLQTIWSQATHNLGQYQILGELWLKPSWTVDINGIQQTQRLHYLQEMLMAFTLRHAYIPVKASFGGENIWIG